MASSLFSWSKLVGCSFYEFAFLFQTSNCYVIFFSFGFALAMHQSNASLEYNLLFVGKQKYICVSFKNRYCSLFSIYFREKIQALHRFFFIFRVLMCVCVCVFGFEENSINNNYCLWHSWNKNIKLFHFLNKKIQIAHINRRVLAIKQFKIYVFIWNHIIKSQHNTTQYNLWLQLTLNQKYGIMRLRFQFNDILW